jgi:D-alanine-D-alanine ligase
MGGISTEREVSLRSGAAVIQALSSRGHEVEGFDVQGPWLDDLPLESFEIAFIALHGTFGEDGTIQRLLEIRGCPYTGSDAVASSLAMDKVSAKRLFGAAGLETPQSEVLYVAEDWESNARRAMALGFPVVLKPASQGSSIGVSVCDTADQVWAGIEGAFRYGPVALAEKFIVGRELTIPILEDRALGLVELKPARRFFDYTAKYEDAGTQYVVRPKLAPGDLRRVEEAAVAAHRVLGCEGFSRVDTILAEGGVVHILEVNTIPGMTERSLFPKGARAAGIEFPELCERIVEGALRRAALNRLTAA